MKYGDIVRTVRIPFAPDYRINTLGVVEMWDGQEWLVIKEVKGSVIVDSVKYRIGKLYKLVWKKKLTRQVSIVQLPTGNSPILPPGQIAPEENQDVPEHQPGQ